MDDDRKTLLVGGIYLGDITLALAALAPEVPPYARGLDIGQLIPADADHESIKQQTDEWLAGAGEPETLSPPIVRLILERAIAGGKFLSAIRCLEMLDEKDKYVEKYMSDAKRFVDQAKPGEAARALVIASNLDIEEGTPFFQYIGAGLHGECAAAPDKCVTRFARDEAVLRSLKYLLSSERVFGLVAELPADTRKELLPRIALERDPDAVRFYTDFKQAHRELKETEEDLIRRLAADVKHVAEVTAGFANALERISPGADAKDSFDTLKRTAAGLRKDFADIDTLVGQWQFRRLADRVDRLLNARDELADAGGRAGGDSSIASAVKPVIAVIDDLRDKGIPEQIESIEQRLTSTQTTMLGRQVSSQEHWQFLREIAFKYPVSPLMVCIQRVNDRWMVVPRWDSEIVGVLKEYFETQPLAGSTPIQDL